MNINEVIILGINYFLSFVLLISALILACLAYYAWKRNKLYISLSLIPVLIYDIGYSFEILCINIEWVKFWVKVEYLGGSFLGVLWLMFALNFTGYKDIIKKKILVLLHIIPILILVINYTNDFHNLFYKKMYMNNNGIFPILEVIHGPFYWVHITYTYSLMFIGIMIFFITCLKSVSIIRIQILLLIIAWIIPWISDMVYMFHLLPLNIELCPFAFSFSGIISSFAIFKFKLLKLTPVALEKVFSNMLDGVIILDSENNIVNFNNSAKSIILELNYIKSGNNKVDEVLNRYEAVIRVINSNKYEESIISITNQEQVKYYKMNVNNIYQENRKIIGKILIFNDITESKNQQEKLLELNKFKDKLFTVVSHDIKSPLSVLVSLIELLDDEEDIYKEENREVIYEIKKNVKNTYGMVENVLLWFRSQMDGVVYNNLSWELLYIIKNSLMLLTQNAELKGIEISYEIPKDISIYADRNMFEIVVRNLFSNAIKFTNKGGSIKIRAKENSGVVTISISDSGIGIESERLRSLFSNSECYTTLGTLGEKGTGIGLMICKQLIEKGNGQIWVESVAGKGSTFYFTIACDKAQSKK